MPCCITSREGDVADRLIRRVGRLRRSLTPVAILLLLASADAVIAQAPVVRDSAGVRIVENDPSVLDGRTPWRIGGEPLLSIGAQDGAQAYLFTYVQGSTVLPDGTIAVTDGASYNVRLFDSAGTHLRTIGRRGQGPGEFQGGTGGVTYIERDRLGVTSGGRMISVFQTTGEFIRSFRPPLEEGHVRGGQPHGGILRDGRSVMWSGESPWQRPIRGSWRRPERVALIDPDGEYVRTIDTFPGIETWVDPLEGGGFRQQGIPFSRGAHVSAVGDRIAVAVSDSYSIRIFDESGDLIQIVRLRRDPRTTARYLERWLDHRVSGLPNPREFRARFAAMPAPEHVPEMEAVLLSRDGYLWVREYRMRWEEEEPAVWHVFDPSGLLQTRLTTPANFRVLEIGSDYLLGVATDDLGIQRVQLRALERR
jgi:hypothetical protein